MLPLLKHVVHFCIGISNKEKPEPVQSWSALALIDCLTTIAGLVAFLPKEVVLKELIEVCISFLFYVNILRNICKNNGEFCNSYKYMIWQDQNCLHVLVLMQIGLEIGVLQVFQISALIFCDELEP